MPKSFYSVPIVIICRDRLEPLRQLVDWLKRAGYTTLIIVDNASTFPPLVEFPQSADAEIVRLGRNLGHLSPWAPEVQAKLDIESLFVVTDCDVVPDEHCPADVVERLAGILLRQADVDKVGLGLRIDDLPDCYALKSEVIAWESQFWEAEVAPGVFRAEVDTTFALYRLAARPHKSSRALRTGAPYLARHLPWYADSAHPTQEQQYYREHLDRDISHWETDRADDRLRLLLGKRADEITTRETVNEAHSPLLTSWLEEPGLGEETKHTPWATPGWPAWNAMSPELEFCEFAGVLARMIEPSFVIETGVGQGFTTRRIAVRLGPDQRLLAFEDDITLRGHLARLPFFNGSNRSMSLVGKSSSAANWW
jgi:hypothetical protein